MPLNGSGSYTVPNQFLPSTTILSALVNGNFSDAATALSTAVYKDGQQTLTANIPFANFKITGLGTGSARTDSINFGQVQDGKANWVLAGGTSDVITATYSPAITALVDGQEFAFRASAANTTTTPTFNPSALGANTITRAGGAALQVNDIPGNLAEIILRYNLANTRYELLNPAQPVLPVIPPEGYLTPVSGTPIITSDSIGATTIYYTPYVGNRVPIYNGTTFVSYAFAELSLALAAGSQVANGLYDVFIFLNSGTVTAAFGPSWGAGSGGNQTAGSCARGTGAGGTALSRVSGILTNAATLSSANNGASTYSIAANQGTYVGTIYVDAAAGQVTCHRSWGQNRKFGISNANNRVPITLQGGDSTASWVYGTITVRASNNAPATWSSAAYNVGSGTSCNGLTTLNGLAEEAITLGFNQFIPAQSSSTGTYQIGIGINSVTAAMSGTVSRIQVLGNGSATFVARLDQAPVLGINTFQACETSVGGASMNPNGTQSFMTFTAQYRG